MYQHRQCHKFCHFWYLSEIYIVSSLLYIIMTTVSGSTFQPANPSLCATFISRSILLMQCAHWTDETNCLSHNRKMSPPMVQSHSYLDVSVRKYFSVFHFPPTFFLLLKSTFHHDQNVIIETNDTVRNNLHSFFFSSLHVPLVRECLLVHVIYFRLALPSAKIAPSPHPRDVAPTFP